MMKGMKAAVFREYGGPEKLIVEEIDQLETKLEPDMVRLTVKAFALNYVDIWTRRGLTNVPLPHVGGTDVAGIIKELGSSVTKFNVGDRVLANPGLSCHKCKFCLRGEQSMCDQFNILGVGTWGGAAEEVLVPSSNLKIINDSMPFTEAAAAPLTFITAYRMLRTKANIKEGETVLVTAASGGVGTAAVQMAKAMGAEVIALTSSEEKMNKLKDLGALFTINYTAEPDWDDVVLDYTNNSGVNIVIDSVGEKTWEKAINSLSKGGRLVTVGATTGSTGPTPIRKLFSKQASIYGSYMGSSRDFGGAMSMFFKGKIHPVIDSVLPMDKIQEAHQKLESGSHIGKMVLTP